MKNKQNIYGNPTPEHMKAMQHTPVKIVDVDLSHHLNPNYPDHGSDAHKEELMRVRRAYENPANSSEYQDIVDHSVKAPFKSFCKQNNIEYPKDLMKELNRDTKYYVLTLKYHFNRPRPYQVAEKLGIPFEKGESFSSGTPAYPSGHSTQARMFATVLGRLFPLYKQDFDIIADSIDRTRLDLGVHYPSDIEAGKKLGKHLGLVCDLSKPTGLAESHLTDPADANIKTRVGLKIQLPPEINVTDAIDAIKAIRDVSTARQFGAQEEAPISGKTTINLYVTVVGGKLSPEGLLKKINVLDDILSAYIKNVDGEKYYASPRRERRMRRPANESSTQDLVKQLIREFVGINARSQEALQTGKLTFDSMLSNLNLSRLERDRLKDIDWAKELKGTLSNQVKNLARLTYEKYGTQNPFLSQTDAGGAFSIDTSGVPESLRTAQPKDLSLDHPDIRTPDDAYYVAYKTSKKTSNGLKAEDALAAWYNKKAGRKIIADAAAGKGGKDLESADGKYTAELKSSQGSSLNTELNSTAISADDEHFYIFLTDRETDAPSGYVISSLFLFYRNFASVVGDGFDPKTGEMDMDTLTTKVQDAIRSELNGAEMVDTIKNAFINPGEKIKRVRINVGGLSLSLRLMFNLKNPKGLSESAVLVSNVGVNVASASELMTEELTKTDKKEIERIAKKTVKKEIEAAMRDFKKSELEKEITKVLGGKASKEELSKVTKAVIKRLYRELSINYPAIIDRIKV